MCLLGKNFQYGLLGEKGCNFIMTLSSGEPQPIFSNVARGPQILALAHHLIMVQYISSLGSVRIQYIGMGYGTIFFHTDNVMGKW